MSFLRLESLYQDKERRNRSNMRVYEAILKQCHRRIQQVNRKLNMNQCYFHIPEYILGYPAYNLSDVNEYLCKRLSKNGLLVYPATESSIYISWDPMDIDYERYQKSLKKEEGRASLDPVTKTLFDPEEDSENEADEPKSKPKKKPQKRAKKTDSTPQPGSKPTPGGSARSSDGSIAWDHAQGVLQFGNDFEDILPVNTKKLRRTAKPSNFPWF